MAHVHINSGLQYDVAYSIQLGGLDCTCSLSTKDGIQTPLLADLHIPRYVAIRCWSTPWLIHALFVAFYS